MGKPMSAKFLVDDDDLSIRSKVLLMIFKHASARFLIKCLIVLEKK